MNPSDLQGIIVEALRRNLKIILADRDIASEIKLSEAHFLVIERNALDQMFSAVAANLAQGLANDIKP